MNGRSRKKMLLLTTASVGMMITSVISSSLQKKTSNNEADIIEKLRNFVDSVLADNTEESNPEEAQGTSKEISDLNEEQNDQMNEMNSDKKWKRDDEIAMAHQRKNGNILSSLYPCDRFDENRRLCTSIRQIGTTLTFGVQVLLTQSPEKYQIRWFRVFKTRYSGADVKEEFKNGITPWNIITGSGRNAYELRISPLTEIDFSYNYFYVTLEMTDKNSRREINKRTVAFMKFCIEPINIDMGNLYHAEEVIIPARAFIELPLISIQYEWKMSDTDLQRSFNLPSSMKLNADRSSVFIKKSHDLGNKIVTCAVYSNKNIFVAKRNFFLRKTVQSLDEVENTNAGIIHRRKRSLEADNDNQFHRDADDMYSYSFPLDNARERFFDKETYKNSHKRNNEHSSYYSGNSPVELPMNIQQNFGDNLHSVRNALNGRSHQTVYSSMKGDRSKLHNVPQLIDQVNSLKLPFFIDNNKPKLPKASHGIFSFEDKESQLIATCKHDDECGTHAFCFTVEDGTSFCRCDDDYKGNGLFCRQIA
ncbi:uncharacterized protein LOC118195391 isoform X1 [Stegodyphus dumicola]|uniref:uncharacterized protein LOC118195391 isoform X1 n=1 Tax=Stegodyphus dumicola TaxID=202533 RepID=UPI0015B0505F|nr:uncharacterized protein LOC118195391 isoform X1 [Stegodyphus dumicola]